MLVFWTNGNFIADSSFNSSFFFSLNWPSIARNFFQSSFLHFCFFLIQYYYFFFHRKSWNEPQQVSLSTFVSITWWICVYDNLIFKFALFITFTTLLYASPVQGRQSIPVDSEMLCLQSWKIIIKLSLNYLLISFLWYRKPGY